MRLFTRFCLLAALEMALASCSYGQNHQNAHPSPPDPISGENTVGELPAHQLVFTASDPVSGFKASSVIMLPVQCTGDGTVFLDMLPPPSFMQQAIYAVNPKSSQSFDLSAITGLHGIELINFFPGSDRVAMLVRATQEQNPASGEAKIRQSAYGYFIALFNRHGEYLKSIALGIHDVFPSHVAALRSGEFLVTAYDRANDMPRLYLVGDDGAVRRSLVLPYNLGQYVSSGDPNVGQGMMNRSRVLGSMLMTAHGDQILVWRRGGTGPMLSVGEHGSTREINLNVPKGFILADVLSSDKLWVAHFQPARHQGDQAQDTHQMSYYEFDPSDGSLTSRLLIRGDSPEHAPAVISCEEEGTFLSYQSDDKGQTRILSAR